jgi:hypothetical protein
MTESVLLGLVVKLRLSSLAVAICWLTDGLTGTAARISRAALLSNAARGLACPCHNWLDRSADCAAARRHGAHLGETFFSGRGRTITSIGSVRPRIGTVRRSS